MSPLFVVFSLIIGLFLLFLALKQFLLPRYPRLCALCGAVFTSWVILLVLKIMSFFSEPILIALLMGQTMVGILYLLERHVPQEVTLFRFPFLLTMLLGGYFLLTPQTIRMEIISVGVLWLIFAGIFLFRRNTSIRVVAQKIVACCKQW